mmetsp:Transcript_12440/g.18428  ORF Transcript_12440/g.18428 Transcript_12440/m.18428 type:complete len:408 (+) Transcript_12440:113-1336(+)
MNCRLLSIAILLLLSKESEGQDTSNLTPTHFFVFGDRYTGVTYLSRLVEENTPLKECRPDNSRELFPADTSWRFGFLGIKDIKRLGCNPETTLFIMIVKDPYAWLSSVAERKYVESSTLHEGHLDVLVHDKQNGQISELNGTGKARKKYQSLMEQRTSKLKVHRNILSNMHHSAFVRYEDLLKNTEKTIKKMLRGRGLSLNDKAFVDNTKRTTGEIDKPIPADARSEFTKRQFYTEKEYLRLFNARTLRTIEQKLDKTLESSIGYHVQPNVPWAKSIQEKTNKRNILHVTWRFIMGILWWTIVPTTLVIVSFTPLIACLRKRNELNSETQIKDDSKWLRAVDPSTGLAYFYHKETRQVRWNRPAKNKDDYDHIRFNQNERKNEVYQHVQSGTSLRKRPSNPFHKKEQ